MKNLNNWVHTFLKIVEFSHFLTLGKKKLFTSFFSIYSTMLEKLFLPVLIIYDLYFNRGFNVPITIFITTLQICYFSCLNSVSSNMLQFWISMNVRKQWRISCWEDIPSQNAYDGSVEWRYCTENAIPYAKNA